MCRTCGQHSLVDGIQQKDRPYQEVMRFLSLGGNVAYCPFVLVLVHLANSTHMYYIYQVTKVWYCGLSTETEENPMAPWSI